MSNQMSLAEAQRRLNDLSYLPTDAARRAYRTIQSVGYVLDKIREENPEMSREQYVFADPVDREVNNTVHDILARIEEALGEET